MTIEGDYYQFFLISQKSFILLTQQNKSILSNQGIKQKNMVERKKKLKKNSRDRLEVLI